MLNESTQQGAATKLPKQLWIVNHYSLLPSKDGSSSRHLDLAIRLRDSGWNTSLIAASTQHPSGRQMLRGRAVRHISNEGGQVALWVRTKSYDTHPRFRALGMVTFAALSTIPGITRGLPRPDAVMGCTVHPLAAWAGLRLAKRYRVPFIYEIRDVWPDTLVDLGAISADGVLARFIRGLSQHLIQEAELVISPLPFIHLHLKELGFHDKETAWIPNGFQAPANFDSLPASREAFTFMYLGTHGNANALEGLLQAFDRACERAPELSLALRLVGDGPLKPDLEAMASALPSSNRISFDDPIPSADVLARAKQADCLVVNLLDKPVYRFGVSLNKFFLYLASGRPLIVASSAPNNPVADADAGITVPGDDRDEIADAMIRMASTPHEERAAMAAAGPPEITKTYSFDKLARRLAQSLESATARFRTRGGRRMYQAPPQGKELR